MSDPEGARLSGARKSSPSGVLAGLESIVRDPAAMDLDKSVSVVSAALTAGESLLACHACERLLEIFPEEPQLVRLSALALARSGATRKANALIGKLAGRGFRDEETLGLLARTYKDLWLQSRTREALAKALEAYLSAHVESGGTWSAINAATLMLASGDEEGARDLATKVLRRYEGLVAEFERSSGASRTEAPGGELPYWDYATLGEAALILRRSDLAAWAYGRAMQSSPGQWGNRASSQRNARLVLTASGQDERFIDEHFPKPCVVAFSGHMIDGPTRDVPRFAASAEREVYARLLRVLTSWDAKIGFSSGAGGSDILFLEALAEIGAETNIVLPHPPAAFIETSVSQNGAGWVARFEKALGRARRITVLSDHVGDVIAYHFTSIVLAGLAKLRAEELCGTLRGLVVWDLKKGDIGGTGTTASDWLERGIPVSRISPFPGDEAVSQLEVRARISGTSELLKTGKQRMISMLFADAVGFSKLTEEQIPRFVQHFLGGVRNVMDRQESAPLTFNTWGDGLYFTFDSVEDANRFAVDLGEFVSGTDWKALGLPGDLGLRIALHTGPAFEIQDPVIRQRGFTGAQVSRAARIEPVTPPGCVYCSESHAALVQLDRASGFFCEYVGNLPLAKNYGVFPAYNLQRIRAAEGKT